MSFFSATSGSFIHFVLPRSIPEHSIRPFFPTPKCPISPTYPNMAAAEGFAPQPEVMSIASPINLILLSLFIVLLYWHFRPKQPVTLPRGPPPVVFRTYTPKTLLEFNGEDGRSVFLAVRGRVFDVSPGRNFYGPGGPYENFAGRDASRGLAHQSFDEDMLTKDLSGPLDDLKDLDADQLENLQSWEERFSEKYLVVGKLVAEGDPEAPKS